MWAANMSATTWGSGMVRRERGVFGAVRVLLRGAIWNSTRTVPPHIKICLGQRRCTNLSDQYT